MATKQRRMTQLHKLETCWAYAFILPALLTISIFVFVPVVNAVIVSLNEWSMFGDMEYVGLQNYRSLLADKVFLDTLGKTFRYSLLYMPALFLTSLFLALIIKHIRFGSGTFRTCYFMPIVLSSTASGIVWRLLFDKKGGAINKVIGLFGGSALPWLGSQKYAIWAALIVHVWLQAGYYMVVFYAGLQDIPRDYYEAASIDGATGWKAFRYITLPCLGNTSLFVLIMSAINSFQAFDQIKMLTNGGPARATLFAVQHIYESAFQLYEMGSASAMAMILFVIVLAVSMLQLKIFSAKKEAGR